MVESHSALANEAPQIIDQTIDTVVSQINSVTATLNPTKAVYLMNDLVTIQLAIPALLSEDKRDCTGLKIAVTPSWSPTGAIELTDMNTLSHNISLTQTGDHQIRKL